MALQQLAALIDYKKVGRIDADLACDSLEALQGQVTLTALDRAHVGAMNAEHIGKGLLTETRCFAMGTQIGPDPLLKCALHGREASTTAT
jgi:hypothetical protein